MIELTAKERELIEERRRKMIEEERRWLNALLLKSIHRRLKFEKKYAEEIPWDILQNRLVEENGDVLAKLEFEDWMRHQFEDATHHYSIMEEQESEMSSIEYNLIEDPDLYFEKSPDVGYFSPPKLNKSKKHSAHLENPINKMEKTSDPEHRASDSEMDDQDKEDLAFNFVKKRYRENKKYTRKEIAEAAGVHPRLLYRRLQGDPADWDTLQRYLNLIESKDGGNIHRQEESF